MTWSVWLALVALLVFVVVQFVLSPTLIARAQPVVGQEGISGGLRVVLGSDWPFVGWDPSPPGWVQSLTSLTQEEKDKILWKNLEQLLGL